MQTKPALVTLATLACVLGLTLPARVQAQREATPKRRQAATVAEERAEIAREEAELARETVALEERKAALAERKAALARREARRTPAASLQASQLGEDLAELRARDTDRGLVLTLGDVVFESDKADLKADAMRKLYPLVTLLKEYPQRQILIEGHTDSSGTASYNRDLSEQRAGAVRDFLVSNGLDPEQITARGYGEAYPVEANTTEAGRQENRRVEVVVLHEGARVPERSRR